MIEAFKWIFRKEEFKKHYIFLLICNVLSVGLAVLLLTGKITSLITMGVILLFIIIGALPLCGYYWNLVENIIGAETDISANSVYNGKIKTVLKIDLPELHFFKLLWRGIASFVASLILIVAYSLIMFSLGFAAGFSSSYFGAISSLLAPMQLIGLGVGMLMFYLFIPALFWNYAKNNSVFSMLNIGKAVYITGNYPGRYICKLFQMFIVYLVNFLILFLVGFPVALTNPKACIITQYIAAIPLGVYFMFVYAYILGTLVPNEEF